ncbi:MAG TPA: hypothetical protein VK796_08605 [Cytophaga sp.]|nr:hypothetical protein [Cytophaga sp.]
MRTLFTSAIIFTFLLNACSEKKSGTEVAKTDTNSTPIEKDSLLTSSVFVSADSLQETEFVPTLENELLLNKNTIYSVSFLMAWNEIKKALKDSILVTADNSRDFKFVNESNSFRQALKPSEYKTEVSSHDGIIVKAYFNKVLPFDNSFDKTKRPLIFKKQAVEAFGMNYYSVDLARIVKIYYYDSDNNFVIGIEAKDSNHEIILAKGISAKGTLLSIFREVEKKIQLGIVEKTKQENLWKYSYLREDKLAIPALQYAIKNTYSTIEGQEFVTYPNVSHVVNEANQQISFCLNENGVAVSDFSRVSVDSMGLFRESKPKSFVFDKPFFFMLKRKDASYPYYAMYITNTELMIKVDAGKNTTNKD